MFFLFFLLWVIFNGQFTVEIAVIGLIVSAAVYFFCCRFLGYSPQKDWAMLKRSGYVLVYVGILLTEIAKANMAALQLILKPHLELEPVVIRFKTDLKSRGARVILANSITLTPGTITVSLEDDQYTVHCLDRRFSEGLEDGVFVKYLRKIEAA